VGDEGFMPGNLYLLLIFVNTLAILRYDITLRNKDTELVKIRDNMRKSGKP
jgi:hypothetical protein